MYFQKFTEGYLNHMYCFNLKSDNEKQNALVVRLFGSIVYGKETLTFGGDEQTMAMQLAHAVGLAQPVIAILRNGIVYRFAPGRTLTLADIQNPDIIRYF